MFWVVASRNGVDVVQLVAIEAPLANELLRELLVVFLNLGQPGTEYSQTTKHSRGLAIFVQHGPIRMFLHYFRDYVFVRFPLAVAVLGHEWVPPNLRVDTFLVEIGSHFLNRIAWERFWARIPIAIGGEPAVIQGSPL